MTDPGAELPPEQQLAVLVEWIGMSADADAEKEEAAAELAGELASLEPEIVRTFAAGGLDPVGVLAVLDRVAADKLPGSLAALASAATDRAGLLALCLAGIGREATRAAGAADILASGSVLSTLLVAVGTTGPSLACLDALAEAARQPGDGLERACATVVVPSEMTRVLARLHEGALRFGDAPALTLVEGHFFGRLLAPILGDAAAPLTGPEPLPAFLETFAQQMVAAGQQAERIAAAGEDADDPAVQRGDALASEVALHLAFAAPTPADPLGTEPAIGVTALGRAISRARTSRRQDYDWAAIQALEETNPEGHGNLVTDERLIVMDLAAAAAGIPLQDPPAG